MAATLALEVGKDISPPLLRRPLPVVKRCSQCGVLIERKLVKNTQAHCVPCRRRIERDRKRLLAVENERKRLLAGLRDLTREGRNRRDGLAFVEEFGRLYHGPHGLAARLQELDADLRAKGDLANQVKLFEAVLVVLARASSPD